jgi:hypothetical protein
MQYLGLDSARERQKCLAEVRSAVHARIRSAGIRTTGNPEFVADVIGPPPLPPPDPEYDVARRDFTEVLDALAATPPSMPLADLALHLIHLADDLDASGFTTDPLRYNAADLFKAAAWHFCAAAMERCQFSDGSVQWMKRTGKRSPVERRREHHLNPTLAMLTDIRDGRTPNGAALKLRAFAKGIESTVATLSVDSAMPPVIAADAGLNVEAKAMAVLVQHPEWSVTRIAQEVDCNRQHLYRLPLFMKARAALKAGRGDIPRGTKDGATGDIEAWDDEDGD